MNTICDIENINSNGKTKKQTQTPWLLLTVGEKPDSGRYHLVYLIPNITKSNWI